MDSNYHIPRSLENYAFDATLVGRHMVFIAGPRQVGKTRLARRWLARKGCEALYFNWDDPVVRKAYLADSRFFESPARLLAVGDPWVVFDEIHKRHKWRDILKGAYDSLGEELHFLVTGSARLDMFRRSGDSLVGRYSLFHLMPLSLAEAAGHSRRNCFLEAATPVDVARGFAREVSVARKEWSDAFDTLCAYGPFPEPFIRQNGRFSRKWHADYATLLIREDLRDISRIVELDKIEQMASLLPLRVGSPLSMLNLAREIEVAHTTVKTWLEQLKRLFLVFPVAPWSKRISRGLRKDKKWYFLDWTYAPEGAATLENMVAAGLYRCCIALSDMGAGDYRLYYVRTLDKREIDFVVTRDDRPLMAVEVKLQDTSLSGALADRGKWFPGEGILGVQVVGAPGVLQRHRDDTWVASAPSFLALLI